MIITSLGFFSLKSWIVETKINQHAADVIREIIVWFKIEKLVTLNLIKKKAFFCYKLENNNLSKASKFFFLSQSLYESATSINWAITELLVKYWF